MATKKATAKKSTSSRTAAAKKTTIVKNTTKVEAKPAKTAPVAASTVSTKQKSLRSLLPKNLAGVVVAEIVGTFALTLVALSTSSLGVLYAGLTVLVMTMAVGAVSKAHFNPAVTFGFWSIRKINWLTGLVYWGAQFVGALVAFVVMLLISGSAFGMDFSHFVTINWAVLAIELIATAVFVFGFTAVAHREDVTVGVKAIGIGLALTVGLFAGGVLLTNAQNSALVTYNNDLQSSSASGETGSTAQPSHILLVDGVLANPAIALASSELTEQQLQYRMQGYSQPAEKTAPTRFGLEVLLGTLAGAALGANLYVLMGYKKKDN